MDDGPRLNQDGPTLKLDGVNLGEDDPGWEPGQAQLLAKEEVGEILEGMKAREQRESQRFDEATDTEYWLCMVFQTRAQKDEFLRKAGWWDKGDKYIDGLWCAQQMGIKVTAPTPPMPQLKVDARFAELTAQEDLE